MRPFFGTLPRPSFRAVLVVVGIKALQTGAAAAYFWLF